jgi:hypothetical protein
MPKIGKNHLIKKSKLVKTTTFVTLLIAATLIFSSIGPATMINNEVNDNNEMNTLNTEDEGTGFTPEVTSDVEMSCDKLQYETYQHRVVTVWDNGMDYNGAFRAEIGPGCTSEIADDFIFPSDTGVNGVHWGFAYWLAQEESPWEILFREDDGSGTTPGDVFAGPFHFEWDDIETVFTPSYWYVGTVDLPSTVIFEGGQKFWIEIYCDGDDVEPYAGWKYHTTVLQSQAMWKWPEYGTPDWVPAGPMLGYPPSDMCFQLLLKPEHDVGIASIDEPTGEEQLCGCLPVKVTAENYGVQDAEDVPVIVEIRKTLFQDSFDDPSAWELGCQGCAWSITTFDSGNPGVVTPRTPLYMAELNSGHGGVGGNCLLAEAGFEDFSDVCNPWLSFWMWHDTYGSDDYLEVWADPGTGWQFVAGPYERLCCPGCPTGWMEHKVSLAAFAGLPFVRIGFKGYCDGNPTAYNLHIDDVTKYDQEFYGETTADIPAGETVEVEFDEEWCPCLYGEVFDTTLDFEIYACTDYELDQFSGNDCMDDIVSIYFPFEIDIASISIDEPTDPIAGANPMKGTIKNVGQTEQCCFKARMAVYTEVIPGGDIFAETFDCWLPSNPHNPNTYYYDDYPCDWEDIGTLYYYDYGWEPSYGSQAGGTPRQAYLYWGYANYYSDNILLSPEIDTTGPYAGVELEFKSMIDWYYGSTYCSMYVEASPDGETWIDYTPWENPITGNIPAATYTVDISDAQSANTQIRFRFYGYYVYFDYWYLDDVIIRGMIPTGDPEYLEEFCVDCVDVCEEAEAVFPDWTPAQPWPDCESKDYAICMWVNPCDPIDQNPANNIVCKRVTIDFWRDVAVSFSSPAPDASAKDTLWDNGPDNGLNGLSCMYWPSYPLDREVVDDFFNTEAWSVTGAGFSGTTYYCSQPGDVNNIRAFFYQDDGGTPSMDRFAEREATDITVTAVGCELTYECEFDAVILPAGDWWVCLQPEFEDNGFWNTADGQGSAVFVGYPDAGYPKWTPGINVFGVDYDVTFQLYGETGVSPGPPIPDVYIPCGEQDLCVNVDNLGVFHESVDVLMELYEFVTDPESPTLAMTGTADDVAVAPGATEEVCFGTYDFAEAGVYWMLVEVILLEDCDPTNNADDIGIGVDCCPPVSMHYPDPLYPNGENNWYTRSVDVEITAEDPLCPDPCYGSSSGLKEIHYIIDGGSEVIVPGDSAEFKLTEDGVHLVEYWAVDNAGNEEDPFTFEIAIDKTAPSVDMFYSVYQDDAGAWHVDFEIKATDATSGNGKAECFIGATKDKEYPAPPYDTWTVDWIDDYKNVDFKVVAYDNAGNSDDAIVPGSQIDDEIHVRSHATAHSVLSARTQSVIFNQQPRSR